MYTKILVPLDGSALAEEVIPYLKWFMSVSNVNEIVLVRAFEPLRMAGGLEYRIASEERRHIEQDSAVLARQYLEKIADQLRNDRVTVTPVVIMGSPARVIADYVARSDVDLIVMATHGYSGIHRWVRGSVADEIFHAASVPVFLVKPRDREPDE